MKIPVVSGFLGYLRDPITDFHASNFLKDYNVILNSGLHRKEDAVYSMKKTLVHTYSMGEKCGCKSKTELSSAVLRKLNQSYPGDFYEKSVPEIFLSRAPVPAVR